LRLLVPDPLDPFEFDDSGSAEPIDPAEPIDEEERASLLADLADLADFREALEARGFRGVVIPCPDCEEDHFFSWDLLRESLEHILEHGEPRVHEPAFDPKIEDYVTWDYAKGFVDGLLEGEQAAARSVTAGAPRSRRPAACAGRWRPAASPTTRSRRS
jgi:hypothetical protein